MTQYTCSQCRHFHNECRLYPPQTVTVPGKIRANKTISKATTTLHYPKVNSKTPVCGQFAKVVIRSIA